MNTTYRLGKCLATVLTLLLLGFANGADAQEFKIGPFKPRPSATLYLVVPRDMVARVNVLTPGSDRLMIRAFDPEENLSFWEYTEPGNRAAGTHFVDIPLKGNGVNQIRISAGGSSCQVEVVIPETVPYGISFQNGEFSAWGGQPGKMYAYVPPRAESLTLIGGPVKILAENNVVLRQQTATAEASISATAYNNTVWSFEFTSSTWKFSASDFPLILCSTADAARLIKASVEILSDGTVVCHKFQRRIAELLPSLLAPENVGTANELIVPLSSLKEEWLKNPLRNSILLDRYSPYGAVVRALSNQNVNPASHWGGATGSGGTSWITIEKLAPPQNRWDRLKSLYTEVELYAGASPASVDCEGMAIAATLDAPFNPYYGNQKILNRVAAAALKDLMVLGEDEVWRGAAQKDGATDYNPYPGFMAFALGQKTLPAYALVAPLMPQNIRDLWTEGLRHIIDRAYPDPLVSARNQSSHYLVAFQDFAKGSGDPLYAKLSKDYADRFIQGQNPAGFAIENQGPDGTYNGMTHWHMAAYARDANSQPMLDALKKSYYFFNHTVAPEPAGNMLGASNFGHRTAGSFVDEQWSGARGIVDGLVQEVALWTPQKTPAQKTQDEQAAATWLSNNLNVQPNTQYPNIAHPRYLYFEDPLRGAVWPASEGASFTRNLGGELIAVKRPAYYTAVYVGKPAPDVLYISGKENFRSPLLNESNGGTINYRSVTPYLDGGLSLFWTPSYGSSILAMNWAPTTHHGLIATLTDGKRYWGDYFLKRYTLSSDNSTLTINGQIESQAIKYERRYEFGDNTIRVQLIIEALQDVNFSYFCENIPVVMGAVKKEGAYIEIPGESAGRATAKSFKIINQRGKSVSVELDAPRELRVYRNGLKYNDTQFARVEIVLPANMLKGQITQFSYTIVAPPVITGVSDVTTNSSQCKVYPNPVSNMLNIKSDKELLKVSVYNIDGTLLRTVNCDKSPFQLYVGDLNNGAYVVFIDTGSEKTIQKFLKVSNPE